MQIHEIFRRQTNEGVLGGIATAMANKTLSTLGSATGIDLKSAAAGGVAAVGSAAAQGAATEMNAPLIKQLAAQAQEDWTKSLSFLMTQKGTNNIDELAPAAEAELRKYINTKMLPRRSGLTNYTDITRKMSGAGPDQVVMANDAVTQIDQAIKNILTAGAKKPELDTAWLNLATNIFEITSMAQFQQRGVGNNPAGNNPAEMSQAAAAAGLTAQDLGIPKGTVKATGNPDADALLKALGLI